MHPVFAATLAAALLGTTPTPADRLANEHVAYETKLLDELASHGEETVALGREASVAFSDGDWASVAKLYAELATKVPTFSHAWRRRCVAEMQMGHRDLALPVCRKALNLADLPENRAALALALVETDEGTSALRDEKKEAIALAQSALDDPALDATVAASACTVGIYTGAAPLIHACVPKLERLAPESSLTGVVATFDAIARDRLDEARTHLERAKANGLDADVYAQIASGLAERESPWDRYGPPFLRLLLLWALGLGILVALGALLSQATLASVRKVAEHGGGKEDATGHGGLRRLYAAVLWLGCLYYYVSMPLVLLTVLVLGGGLIYGFFALGHLPLKLVIIIAAVVLVSVWSILKSLYVSVVAGREGDPGERLDLATEPRLQATLREVAERVGTRPVDLVFVTPGTDLAVFERGGIARQLAGRSERCLILGVGVLDGLEQGELKAVLAHEYGHFVNRDTAGGGFALAVRRSLLQMARTLAEGGAATWYNPAWWFVSGFYRVFLRISQGASRLQEVLADRWAAFAYGAERFSRGLRGAIAQTIRFDAHAGATLAEVIGEKKALTNLYRFEPSEAPDAQEIERAIDEALNAEASAYDSHPRPVDRMAWVAQLRIDAIASGPDDDRAAWELFSNRETLERAQTRVVRHNLVAAGQIELPEDDEPGEARATT